MNISKLPPGVGTAFFAVLMGPCAAGKTTIAGTLAHYLTALSKEHAPIVLDTSAVIRLHMQMRTTIGIKLTELKAGMQPHELFKDCVTIEAVITHIIGQFERAQNRADGIVLSGSPRTKRQFELLGRAGVNGNLRGIHLQVGIEFAIEKAKKRTANGSNREDDQCFNERWDTHQRFEGPLLHKIRRHVRTKPSALLTVDKEKTGLLDSIRLILEHLFDHAPEGKRRDFLSEARNGCYGNIHPILAEICAHVENPDTLSPERNDHWRKKLQEPLVGV